MDTERVTLRHLPGGSAASVTLREPCGRDEIAVEGVDTRAAVALLERLLRGHGPAVPGAMDLAASDRDALLASLHRQLWGDRVRSTLPCTGCGKRFDVAFELSTLQRHLGEASGDWRAVVGGAIANADGDTWRVPTAREEMDAIAEDARGAAARLAARAGVGADDIARAARALEAGAPIIDAEIEAACAECGAAQLTHFDLQSFVLQRLLDERPALLAEVHVLADGYGWSLREILALERRTRRALAALVAEARSRAAARPPRVALP